ncbi:MAG: elongation factor Ts [Candidatus Vogelbacteria bacterium CG10_big_fil_rev_8_21_14_0_10_45_14]|uniref:Elongation factor Ts n=1 Tax=Candidatus Vogelbacteria bacterium CG10_big_fil_rev_8_21_14_0_10_45_14 TaxID=1975042 RepID=A0A2H0RIR0_9BACT|nr:MAG: elongation factor Ts [Candidatus Vogelbacteria bacterium CG10_big_fil_rev_8_21_14_0_10_45_14]
MSNTENIKILREETGLSFAQIKTALEKSGDDMDKARKELQTLATKVAEKKADREFGSATVASYIHAGGKTGVLLELSCETDFVSANEEFKTLARDIAMHIAAMQPVNKDELLDQPFVKNPDITIGSLLEGAVQKFGENTAITRAVWYAVGGEGATL